MCEIYPEKLITLPAPLLESLMQSILFGMQQYVQSCSLACWRVKA